MYVSLLVNLQMRRADNNAIVLFLFPGGRLPRIYTMIRNYTHPTLTKGQTTCVTCIHQRRGN